jgi:alpha-glucosidase
MAFDILQTDWTKARAKMGAWRAPARARDIFAGTLAAESATINDLPVSRFIVRPLLEDGSLAPVSKSFATDFQPCESEKSFYECEWDYEEKVDQKSLCLPFNLTWLQAKPGRFDFHFELPAHVRCLGLGERFANLNIRGNTHTLFSTDNPNHNEHADMLYKSIPFLILNDGPLYSGIWVDSPAPQRWDLDTELNGTAKIELFTRLGFNIYVFAPTTLADLVCAFTALTGRSALPPLWSLGHQQCRWSYPDQATIRDLAREFRSRKIPCDTLVLDIDYMDEYRVFTHSNERFPDFKKLAGELARDHFKLITIVDPGVKKDEKFEIYRQGLSGDHFCKTAKGEVFIETVWPGLSAFPDFLSEKTRQWWGDKLKFYVDNGIAGIWNDMNEPAMFNNQKPLPVPLVELPEAQSQLFLQQGEDGAVGHFEVRNLYGFLMGQATHQALTRYRPDERPFVLTRSASTGIQRHAAVWLGDNSSWYEHLQKSLPMLLNMGLSGVPFAGVDIGGFGGDTTPELLVRWYEMGIFYPFFRNHCALMGRAQEPFSFSPKVEAMVRHLIETRYRLLPYIQDLFWMHRRSGAPLMRPLAWEFEDQVSRECEDQFMFGDSIMVAPVVQPNQRSRRVYFPEGRWCTLESLLADHGAGVQIYEGGQTILVNCQLGSVPAFVREGSILPVADIMQSTAEYPSTDITFYAFGDRASCIHKEDDGISLGYQKQEYGEWMIYIHDGDFDARPIVSGMAGPKRRYFFMPSGSSKKLPCDLPLK